MIARDMFFALLASPGRIAVSDKNEAVTAGQLVEFSASAAAHLADNGVGQGARVAICLRNNIDGVILFLACWRLSATPILLDFRMPVQQRVGVIETFDIGLFVEDRRPTGDATYQSLTWQPEWRTDRAGADDLNNLMDTQPAFFGVSSGTTGLPKAYVQTHKGLESRLKFRNSLEVDKQRLFLAPMALSFAATSNNVLICLLFGIEIHFFPVLFSPDQLIEAFLSRKVTGTALAPPVIRALLAEAGVRDTPLFPDMAVLKSVGGPARPEDKVAAYHKLSHGYLMNYGSGLAGVAAMLFGADVLRYPDSVGAPLPGVSLDILDPTTREVLPVGETGLIRVNSPDVAERIIGQSFSDEELGPGWAIAGDLGHLNEDGFLTITGRNSDMIIRGGVNVSPLEAERILREHPSVTDVAVVGIEDTHLGQEIAAFIVAPGETEETFHRYCMARIAPDKRPRKIIMADSLPHNANGKLDRKALRISGVAGD